LTLAGDGAGLGQRLESLRYELSNLGDMSAPAQMISAVRAGTYSTRVDGFERLGPADLATIDTVELRLLLERRYRGDEIQAGAGKLVMGSTWYYAALVPEAEADSLLARLERRERIPNRVTVGFPGISATGVPMRVYAVGPVENGYAVAVFATDTALVETLGLRQVDARIVYSEFSGIRVPREALRWGETDEETGAAPAYLFTLSIVGIAEQKYVVVLYEGRDYYLVRPDTGRTPEDASLREGNTIIVRSRNLYDGRVIRR